MKTYFNLLMIIFGIIMSLPAQNFTFRTIDCPELPEDGGLGNVHLFSSGEAIFTGRLADAYYNGNTVSVSASIHQKSTLSAIEENGKVFAYSFRDDKYLYKWNDSIKTWIVLVFLHQCTIIMVKFSWFHRQLLYVCLMEILVTLYAFGNIILPIPLLPY